MIISYFPRLLGLARSGFVFLTVAAAAVVLSSCRTTAGLGRDIQHVGSKLGNAAERAM